jgi:SsrA-binding protein
MVECLLENSEARGFKTAYKVEAGMVLTGSETKAIKSKNGHLGGSYLKFINGEPYLIGFKVGQYSFSSDANFNTDRSKKVLLNKNEIDRINGLLSQKGLVCVPSRIYSSGRYLKVELLAGKVLRNFEKREKRKKKEQEREVAQYVD